MIVTVILKKFAPTPYRVGNGRRVDTIVSYAARHSQSERVTAGVKRIDGRMCPYDEIVVGRKYALQFTNDKVTMFKPVPISEGGTNTCQS